MSTARRLEPVNAALALLIGHDVWPSVLADAGFRLEGLEVPVRNAHGGTELDVVAIHRQTNLLFGLEAKSGGNVDEGQAKMLQSITARDVVRTGAVTLPSRIEPRLEIAYICLEEHTQRIEFGLGKVGWDPPVLSVGTAQVRLVGGEFADAGLQAAVAKSLEVPGPAPTYVRFDAESTAPYRGAQHRLRKRVLEAARMVADDDAETFRVLPRTRTRPDELVEIRRSPEQLELQGRTQSYQAIKRRVNRSEPSGPLRGDQPVFIDEGPTSEGGDGPQRA
ncbi:MAG: hypothetical protein ACRDZ4_21565 [Egibacteraceae bacterium]